jgi:hypothetical protein
MHGVCSSRIAEQGSLECGVVEQAAVRLQHQQLRVGALHDVREVPAATTLADTSCMTISM